MAEDKMVGERAIRQSVARYQQLHSSGRRKASRAEGDELAADGFVRGRKFSAEELQLLLLALLAERPGHGYELIKAVQTRSRGGYAPSPGVVYPALGYLEGMGLATVLPQGKRKCYSAADAGLAFLALNRERVDGLLQQLGQLARQMDVLRQGPAVEGSTVAGLPPLAEALEALLGAVVVRSAASAAEQERVAAILAQARVAIEGGG